MPKKSFIIIIIFILLKINLLAQEDATVAKTYFAKANQFNAKMLLDSATYYYKEAEIIYQNNEKWTNYLTCEYYIGQILLFDGKLDDAQVVFENIEKISLDKINNSNSLLAVSYSALGQIYFHKANNGVAIDYFDKALNIQQVLKGDSSIEVANIYNSFGNVYAQMGENQMALEFYDKDIKIRTLIYGEKSSELIKTLINTAIIYNNQGEYDKALEIRNNALQLAINSTGENNLDVAEIYSGIGSIYINKQEYELAKEYIIKAIKIKQTILGINHFKLSEDYINLGIAYKQTLDLDNALDYYNKAIEIQIANFGDNHPDVALTYNNLGLIAKEQKNYDAALQYFNMALKILKSNYGEFNPDIATIYSNIGVTYFESKDTSNAITNYEKAISINESIFGEKHPSLVEPNLNMANIYYLQKNDKMALNYFQNSIKANVKDFEPIEYTENPKLENYYDPNKLLESLQGKARTMAGKFDNDSLQTDLLLAFSTYQLCDTLIDIIRKITSSKQDKITFAAKVVDIYTNAIETCLKLDDYFGNNNLYKEYAFYFSEKNKAGSLLEAISGAAAQKFAGIPDELIEQERYLSQQIAYYEKQLAELSDANNEDFYRNQLFTNNTEYRELISGFEKNYPKYYEMKYSTRNATVKDIQAMLNDSTAMRSYFLSETKIYIFTITKNNITIDYTTKVKNFETQFHQFSTAITSGKTASIQLYQKLAFTFYTQLFPTEIPNEINKLIIIPDGIISTIPFEALLTEAYTGDIKTYKNYPFLIKKYNISYSYSANLFYLTFKSNNLQRPKKEWIGVAPVFAEDNPMLFGGVQVISLPGSETEVNEICTKLLSKNLVAEKMLNKDASESRFKLLTLTDYKFIHIATHGFVNAETPELSGILLCKNAVTGDDGILYNGEIYNLKLNSDLVILSACETGLGKISKGEGVIGLSRAFLYAGTRNIIVSLWQVSDASTSLMMQQFYDNYLNETKDFSKMSDFSTALYQAKLKLIEDPTYGHPYFWSSFILIGK